MQSLKSIKQHAYQTLLLAFLIGATTFLFVSCNTKNNSINNNASPDSLVVTATNHSGLDSTVLYLLEASAADFIAHQSPLPTTFRHVTVKDLPEKNGAHHYMLCGEFLSATEGESSKWVTFATIKTSGYEQWIGGQSVGYCTEATPVKYQVADLSGELQKRLHK